MRTRVAMRTVLLVAGEAAAVGLLHRLGSAPGFGLPGSDVAAWLRETPPLDVTAAVLRLVALGAAWWLLASTLWWLVVALRGGRGPRRALTMPGTRRLVEAALALTIAGASLTGPAAWAAARGRSGPATTTATPTTPTTPTLVLEHVDRRGTATTTTTTPTGSGAPRIRTGRGGLAAVPASPPAGPSPTAPAAAGPAPAPVAPPAPARVHIVAPGENLWTIAAGHVGAATGRPAVAVPAVDVAPYWRALCDANRATVRSGNPSLVYPGEVLQLPTG